MGTCVASVRQPLEFTARRTVEERRRADLTAAAAPSVVAPLRHGGGFTEPAHLAAWHDVRSTEPEGRPEAVTGGRMDGHAGGI